jgi:hypothetical protein
LSQESEANPDDKIAQYVILDIGGSNCLAMPMDCFLEYNADLVVVGFDGYGMDKKLKIINDKLIDFSMVQGDTIRMLQVRQKLLDSTLPSDPD